MVKILNLSAGIYISSCEIFMSDLQNEVSKIG